MSSAPDRQQTPGAEPSQGGNSGGPLPPLPPRSALDGLAASVLKDEGDEAARVLRYDLPEGPVVLKEWKPRSRVLGLWARLMMSREIRHYRLLQGLEGVPRLVGVYDSTSFVLEWVDGEPTRRQLPPDRLVAGLDRLPAVLEGLHSRRFVHLDLHQRRNILIGPRGEVWLIDLGQGLDCSGPFLRLLFPWLARIDRKATVKFRARYAPDTLPEDQREHLTDKHTRRPTGPWKRFWRAFRDRFISDAG